METLRTVHGVTLRSIVQRILYNAIEIERSSFRLLVTYFGQMQNEDRKH